MRIFTFFRVCLLLLSALLLPGYGYAQAYLLPTSGTASYTTCAGTLYDDGGAAGPYSLLASGAVTLLPATPGNKIQLDFTQFELASLADRLVVYDGPSALAPVLTTYLQGSTPGTVYASTSSGALTVSLVSGGLGGAGRGFAATISCVASVPLPDLSVRSARLSVPQQQPGLNLGLSASLVNLSGGLAPPARLDFYLSADATLSTDDVLLDYRSGNTPLPAGSAAPYYALATLPANTAPGSYQVLFVADPANAIPESDEGNNLAAVPLTVVGPGPDLTSQVSYLYPSPALPGAALTMACQLSNQGTRVAAPATVGFYLSADSLLSPNDLLLDAGSLPQLYPATTTVYGSGTLPATTAPGKYYLLCMADHLGQVAETDETNNLSFRRFYVTSASLDVTILPTPLLVQSTVAASGDPVQLTCYAQNAGNVPASPVQVGFYLSSDATLSANDVLLGQQTLGSMYAGQNLPATTTVRVPAGTAPGSYYVLFVADYQNLLAEANESNNVQAAPLRIALPDIDLLVGAPVTSQPRPLAGTAFSVSCTLLNAGATAAMPASVGLYYSDDDQLDASDVLTGAVSYGIVAGNSSQSIVTTFNLSLLATGGRHYILFVADYRNELAETNESNNVAALAIDVVPAQVDLTIRAPQLAPTPVAAGLPATATCQLANLGISRSLTDRVGYYLSADATLDAADLLLNPPQAGTISSGVPPTTTLSKSALLTIPASVAGGSYYLLFVADDQQAVAETDETNNVAALAVQVLPALPDLAVPTGTLAAPTAPAGTTLAATATIANIGSGPASQSPLGFYLSANTTFDAADVLLLTSAGGPLIPAQQDARSVSLQLPAATPPGSYYVLRVADPLNVVAELDEANNVAALPLTVTAAYAGLVVPQAGTATATACTGTVTDNGGPVNYADNSRGSLTLRPGTAGGRVQLTFSMFDTEPGADYLQVFDGPDSSAPLLGIYSGSQLPAPVAASLANTSGALTLQFVSDASVNGAGFAASISCLQPLAATGAAALPGFVVAPNPALAGAPLRMRLGGVAAGPATLTLCNALGQLVATRTLAAGPATEAELPTTGLAPGLYLLQLHAADGQQVVRRVVVQ